MQLLVAFDYRSSPDMESAVKKLVSWTHDPKSRDVSSSARHALCCMFDLNPADFTLLMSRLPKQEEVSFLSSCFLLPFTFTEMISLFQLQSAIKSILEDSPRPRRTTMENSYSSPGSPFLRYSSPMHSPGMVKPLARRGLSMDDTDTENMNPEEVYSRLQATSTQIQNSFKVSDNTSRDSGISQVSEDVAKCDTEKVSHIFLSLLLCTMDGGNPDWFYRWLEIHYKVTVVRGILDPCSQTNQMSLMDLPLHLGNISKVCTSFLLWTSCHLC